MDPSSTSNSDSSVNTREIFAAVCLALMVFLVSTLVVRALPDNMLVEADSVLIRGMKLTDSSYLNSNKLHPKILVLGTSRLLDTDVNVLAAQTGLLPDEVLNLSSPGATFFYMDAFLNRHPEVARDLEFVVIDILAFQIMYNNSFQESASFFQRYATLDQRWVVRDNRERYSALADYFAPAWSRSQTPAQWYDGLRRRSMTPAEIEEDIKKRPLNDFPQWKSMFQDLAKIAGDGQAIRLLIADRLICEKDVAQSQIVSLQNIMDRMPESATLVLLDMPIDDTTSTLIEQTPYLNQSMTYFREFVDGLEHPKLKIVKFETPESLGFEEGDFKNDGMHPSISGSRKVTAMLAQLYKERGQ